MPTLRHFAIFPFVKVFFSLRMSSLSSSTVVQLLLTNLIMYFIVKCCPVGISPVHLSSFSGSSYVETDLPSLLPSAFGSVLCFLHAHILPGFVYLNTSNYCLCNVNATVQTAKARRYKGRKFAL